MKTKNDLLTEFKLNDLFTLKNRIVMAPMTRLKADENFVPTPIMAEYYGRRADAGLIVTEGTIIAANGRGHNQVPGLFTQAQVDGWRYVTDKVHMQGGILFAQIWHVGRVSHPSLLHGELPISASATRLSGPVPRFENLTYGQARAASAAEIKELIQCYAVELNNMTMSGFLRHYYRGNLIGCGSYTFQAAAAAVHNGNFDLIAFGRPFIANPNLVALLHKKAELRSYDVSMLQMLY